MKEKQFEKIHKAFLKSYNIDVDEAAFRPEQKEYKSLKNKINKIIS